MRSTTGQIRGDDLASTRVNHKVQLAAPDRGQYETGILEEAARMLQEVEERINGGGLGIG
jgi:hypothetical protein